MLNLLAKDFPPSLVEIKSSKILLGQIGVFAVRDLEIGIIVGDTKLIDYGLFCFWDEYEKLDKETQKIVDNYCLGTPEGFYAPKNINYIPIPWHFNHSCDPNIGFDENGSFVVIRRVNKGDELFYDYGFGESNPNFKMECKCSSVNCRKIITGNDWKNPIFFQKYKDYIMPELKEQLSL